MFIENTVAVIKKFYNEYVGCNNENEDYTDIRTINGKVRFTYNNDYYLFAWIDDTGALKIENEYGDEIFDRNLSAVVITVEEIREQALGLKKYLSELDTVYDCTGLEFDGYDETDTKVIVDGKETTVSHIVYGQFGGDYNKVKEANIKIQAVRVQNRNASDMCNYGVCAAYYNKETEEFIFDVGDVNYSHIDLLLENVTLDTLDDRFSKLFITIKKEKKYEL